MCKISLLAIGVFIALIEIANAKGVCSTGAYNTCVACCKTHPTVTNRELCVYQCGDYKILERQKQQTKDK